MSAMIRTTALALVLALWSAVTGAAPGELDTTFGSGGEAVYAFGGSTAVAPMPDGRLLMYDTNAVSGGQVRLRTRMLSANGQPVPGWGVGGESVINFNFDPYLQTTWTAGDFKLAGAPDGAVVGILHLGNYGSNPPSANTITLVRAIRLRADGTHDAAYAALSPANLEDTRNGDFVSYVPPFAQPDGSVLISYACSGCDEYPTPKGLQRLRADGSAATFYSSSSFVYDARVLADGKVLVAHEVGATRYNADGSIDTTYGIQGHFYPWGDAVNNALGTFIGGIDMGVSDASIDTNGKVTCALWVERHVPIPSPFFLERADSSGRLDPGFGIAGNGIAQADFSSSPWRADTAHLGEDGLVVAPSGSMVVDLFAASGTLIWRLDASGRQLANEPLPGIQTVFQWSNYFQFFYKILSLTDSGSIYMLTSRSVIRLSANAANPPVPGLLLVASGIPIDEDSIAGTDTVTIAVARVGGSGGRISVDYATGASAALSATGPVATAGIDYDAASGRLEWADGEQGSKYIQLKVHNDSSREPWERLEISFSNIVGAPLRLPESITVTILASDQVVPPPAPTPAPTPGGAPSGGGGEMDLWTLLLLVACTLLLQRRHSRAKMTPLQALSRHRDQR